MNIESIMHGTREAIAEIKKLNVDEVQLLPEEDFVTKYNVDSLDAVQLTMILAEKFDFNFGESVDDIDSLESFGSLTKLIEKRIS